jgi:tol-pal system protein YbgF
MRFSRFNLRVLGAAALVAAVSSSAIAQSGRLSLAERVQRLEQQEQGGGQSTVELLNRITELQTEIQSLRGTVEQQTFKIEELEKRNRDQYLDLDARITRMQGGAGTGAPLMDPEAVPPQSTPEPAPDGTFADVPATDPNAYDPNETMPSDSVMEPPEVREPIDGGVTTDIPPSSDPGIIESTADPLDERRMYESAFDSLKEGRYAEAARRFQSFLDQYPRGEYSPNAQYWLGESYYVTQNYQIALEAFQGLLTQFPSSNKAPDALLKVGYCHYELRQWEQAESTLNQVVQQYPDTTVARLAQGRLRALRLENRQ